MKEIICPKCNNIQKIGHINICSYCYHNFSQSDTSVIKPNVIEDKLSNNQIEDILNFKKKTNKPDKSIFYIKVGLFLSLSFLLFFIDCKLFPIFMSESYFIFISLITSIITTYFSYRYLSKFFSLENIAESWFYRTRSGRDTTKFEQMLSLCFVLYFVNWSFNYFAIYALNDFSSILIPSKTHQTFIYKETQSVKGGYNYYLNVTNWKKNKDTSIKLKTSLMVWNKYQDQKSAIVKVKRGIFEDVVWSIKQ